jgi:putative hydrolase of the HAD superfamily
MHEIKNIILDLGVVILNVDYEKTIDAFAELGIVNGAYISSKAQQDPVFDQWEKGEISASEFCDHIRRIIQDTSITEEAIYGAWNAMLGDLPYERISLLRKIKNRYRLFLLSNTNAVHLPFFNQIIKEKYGLENLSSIFEKEYYSHLIGMRKPEQRVFDHVINENQLHREETLFVDDSSQHVEGGNRVGIPSVLLEPDKTLLDLFDSKGVWIG